MIFLTALTPIPVKIWIRPSASDPIMMGMVSFSGVNSDGSSKVLFGLMILQSCGMKSPKKPPVSAPKIKVLMPHQKIISMKLRSAGRFFFRKIRDPAIIRMP